MSNFRLMGMIGAMACVIWLGSISASTIQCKGYDGSPLMVKSKTISIHNNTEGTIYPVLSTSKNLVNEWIQACFRSTDPYPSNYVYKLYVNQNQGISPGSSVTITLPLFSQISDNQYITWWNGGRVVIADKRDRLRNSNDNKLEQLPNGLDCQGKGTSCQLSVYASDQQFPEDIYAQLSEYTFGDSIIPPNQSVRLLKPENVGYNISYVDHVYLPVAIGPKHNPYIGYSGSIQTLKTFRTHLKHFLNSTIGKGWPLYNLREVKLPGGYNIFAQRFGTLPPDDDVPVKPTDGFPPVLTVLPCLQGGCNEQQKANLHFGDSVQRMQNLWGSCVDWQEDLSPYVTETINCPDEMKRNLTAIQQFFLQNHRQYLQLYKEGKCNNDKPVSFTYWQAITHIYGWVPFNEGCGPGANPLVDTKINGWDHAKIQSMYIHELQYNFQQDNIPDELLFNPYVKLIHAKNKLAMDAYAFSVDDAVGFMSELGDGLIFTVGGSKGLDNRQPFNYASGFSVAIGVPVIMVDKINTPLIKKYGVCAMSNSHSLKDCDPVNQNVTMPDNSQISGFRVGNVPSYPIRVRFTDLDDNVYTFNVNSKFAPCPNDVEPASCPTNRDQIFNKNNCTVMDKAGNKHPKSEQWCASAIPNQNREKQITKNFLSFAQPVRFLP